MPAALWVFMACLQKYKASNQDKCLMTVWMDQVEAAFRARSWTVSGYLPRL